MREHIYYVYVLTNCSRRPLYTGITNSTRVRLEHHKNPAPSSNAFTQRYQIDRLVYWESYKYVNSAISREKQLKRWSRKKKIFLIERENPNWNDLSREWGTPIDFAQLVADAEQFQK